MPRKMSFTQFQKSLLGGRIDPVYCFDGEERFFHEEGLRILEKAVFPHGLSAVDRDVTRGGEATFDQILDIASTYPMEGGLRLVIVRDADDLKSDTIGSLKDYLKRPNPKSCLVFSDTGFDRRRSLWRSLQAGATVIECQALGETRTVRWVRERLRERGFGVSDALAEAIAAGSVGQGLGRLDAEIEKLMVSIGEPRPVQPDDLEILSGVPRIGDVWAAARLMLNGERGRAIAAVRDLLRRGEEGIQLLGGLSWYVRMALKTQAAADRHLPPRELTQVYGIDPGRFERFRREIRPIPVDRLSRALTLCLRADRELKGAGARDPANAIERLVHQIGRMAERRAS